MIWRPAAGDGGRAGMAALAGAHVLRVHDAGAPGTCYWYHRLRKRSAEHHDLDKPSNFP